jgi:hypothetical protein
MAAERVVSSRFGGRHLPGVKLEPVQSGSHGKVALAKSSSLSFALDFGQRKPESASSCHHWAEQKNSATRKVLLQAVAERNGSSCTLASAPVLLDVGQTTLEFRTEVGLFRCDMNRLPGKLSSQPAVQISTRRIDVSTSFLDWHT